MTRATGRGLVAVAVAVAVATAIVAACSRADDIDLGRAGDPATTRSTTVGGAPTSTDTTTAAPTVTTPTTTAPPPIDWATCGNGRQCATVAVPLDHDVAGGPTIDVAVARLPATGERTGALFLNFGGPGAEAATTIGLVDIPDAVRQRFDIVGMDPRGVGASSPLLCGIPPATLYAADPTIEDTADRDALVGVSEEFADDCAAAKGAVLPHVGTWDVARDMDLIRAAMGDETLSYVGFSYGTSLGQAYAALFPQRVRAMVLDGVVDPAPPGIEVAVDQARGFETALANWAGGCPSRPSCSLEDPVGSVEAMLAAAEADIPAGGRTLGPGEAAIGLAFPLYSESLWPRLDRAVADALAGDGARMLELASGYLGLIDFSIYFAVSCLDSTWPTDVDGFLADAKQAAAVAPRFGEAIVTDYLRCAVWPTPPQPLGAITAEGTPPILVVSTTGDPATPYENGVRVADRLATGVLLTYEGEGHTVVFGGSGCVDGIVTRYLVDLEAPADRSVC